jgi:uncharacterized membrane protein
MVRHGKRPVTGIRLKNELLLINLCSALLLVVIWLVDVWILRLVLGLPFLLFFPGYTLMANLFPRKGDLGVVQRVALSVAFSIIVSPAVGFALNFLWKIELWPVLVGITAVTAVMSALAWIRRRSIPEEERLEIVLTPPFQAGGRFSALNKMLSMVLVLAFLAAIVTLALVVANPKEGERYSGFYVRGAQSRPTEVSAGEPTIVTLGITNHEMETMTYSIEVRAGVNLLKTTDPIRLAQGGAWENEVSFVPTERCATTELAQDVTAATDNALLPEVRSIQVTSVEHLAPGDRIWVGQESAVVKAITGTTVALTEALEQAHAAGTDVMEVLRVEFRLLKIRQVGGQAGTSLSLWVGKDHLEADVSNLGQTQAAYQIALRVGESYQEETTKIDSAVQTVSGGQVWTQQVDYDFSENHEIEFSLYKDGKLAYQRLESGCYPSLYLWIHVK